MEERYLMQCLMFHLLKWHSQLYTVQLEMRPPAAMSYANMLEGTIFSTQFS